MTAPVTHGLDRRRGHEGRCTGCVYPGESSPEWPWALCPHNPRNHLTPDMTQPAERKNR